MTAPGALRRVVLWRHGQTAWNAEHRFQGHSDVPLDDIGEEQSVRAARLLAALPPATVVCSDLRRARETAAPLLQLTGLTARYDARLRETHGGSWQGLTGTEIDARAGETWAAWRGGADLPAGGSGERRSEVGTRAAQAVRETLDGLAAGEVLVVVTHGGTIRAVIGTMLGLPIAHWSAIGGLSNCAWSVLEESDSGRWRLEEHNAGMLPTPVDTDVL